MAFSTSKVYAVAISDALNKTTNGPDMDADSFKAALFDNSITPDNTVTAANSAYAAGVWASGGVSDASGWPAAGRALVSVTATRSSGTYTFDAADTASANSATTLAGTYGCLVYDTTSTAVTNQGVSFNYFGGTQSVTAGSFTIVWNASGLWTVAA